MIELNGVCLNLPGFCLDNIHLTIPKGDFFSLIGPTGSGKSLMLEVIMGLMPVSGGRIRMNGRDITKLAVEKRKIGIVYQDFSLFPHLSVRQNIYFGVPYHPMSKKEAASRFDSLVSTLGLERILDRYPEKLSGGEKQRVALARSLILRPELLLLDEPLSALDPVFHEEAQEMLKKIHQEIDITIVMVSHSFPDVVYLANSGAIIYQGRIRQQGTIDSLFETPNSTFCAKFVGMKNIFSFDMLPSSSEEVRINGSPVVIETRQKPKPDHRYLGIRPEDIRLGNTVSGHHLEGTVTHISSHGMYINVRLASSGLSFHATWPGNYKRYKMIQPGESVDFTIPDSAVHLF